MIAFQFFKGGGFLFVCLFISPETPNPYVIESWGVDFIILLSIFGSSAMWHEVEAGASTDSLNKWA